jgi:hypothetical protein
MLNADKVCGVGPGMIFANTILKQYKDPEKARIGLVPCAIGGTAIKEWEKGSTLYKNMITRTKAALNHGGVLRAILWYQGESDTGSEKNANNYKHNLEKLIHDIRFDLQHPDLLFIQVMGFLILFIQLGIFDIGFVLRILCSKGVPRPRVFLVLNKDLGADLLCKLCALYILNAY